MGYLWLKALHVVAVLLFAGGLLMQTVVLAGTHEGSSATLAAVERWDRRITIPAMLAVWLFGTTLAVQAGFGAARWLIVKVAIVVALSGWHGIQGARLRRLVTVPTSTLGGTNAAMIFVPLALAAIVTLVVVKPF